MNKKDKPTIDSSRDRPLPATRWRLLSETLRYRYWDLIGVSILTGLFYLPLVGWLLYAALTGLADPGNLLSVLLTYAAAVPLTMVAGLGEAGSLYFSKKLAWGQGASLPGDFFEGIAKNFKMFLLVYFLIGSLYLLLKLDLVSVALSSFPSWSKTVLDGLSYGLFFVFLMPLLFLAAETVIYEGSFLPLLKNGFRFTFGAILANIPLFGAFLLPFLVYEFVPFLVAAIAAFLFASLFYFGFSAFFFTEYSHHLFDRSINRDHYPEIIRKGLAKIHENHDHDQ